MAEIFSPAPDFEQKVADIIKDHYNGNLSDFQPVIGFIKDDGDLAVISASLGNTVTPASASGCPAGYVLKRLPNGISYCQKI